ncbi:MAG: GreA/GreB family elongation factor [Acidobacteriia bacterium]|nr:GreA/GreB family elongation factor [Terriglobia bacterium]
MKNRSIMVTDADMDRLSRLVRALKHSLFRDQLQLESLEQTLESAEVTSSKRIPRDVIRMNSSIRLLDLDTRKKQLYSLVFPDNADISTSRVSVLAPVGIALLGRSQGDVIETKVPGGAKRLRAERVLQRPEITRRQARSDRSNRRELHSSRTIQSASLAA